MTDKVKLQETMWAEHKPDVYDGPNCDQVRPRWEVYADGDMDSDTSADVELSARTFPPGTKIVISEPLCPSCGELREPIHPAPETGPIYSGPCRCGFDWDKWVSDQYS